MSVKLNIKANVTGAGQVKKLNAGLVATGAASKKASKGLRDMGKVAQRGRNQIAGLATALNVGLAAGFAAVSLGAGKFIKDTFDAGNTVESLQIRFKLLFGSVEEGAKSFDTLTKFAAKVPFSLEEISKGSGNLAVISKDADELNEILKVTGNVAAATGLDFQQTATQIQRSFAGGIASADIFRERGVRAMLGFEAGVKVSVEETKKRFFEVFGKGGTFGNATVELAKTLQGQVSMVQDKYFKFRQVVSKQFFGVLTKQIKNLNKELESEEEAFNKLATTVGENLGKAFLKIESAIRFLIENWEKFNSVIKTFIAYKVAGIILTVSAAVATLNATMRANPLGAFITAIQLLIAGFVLFDKQLNEYNIKTMQFLNKVYNQALIGVLEFVDALNFIPGITIDVSDALAKANAEVTSMTNELSGLAEEWRNAADAQEAYRETSLGQETRMDRMKAYKGLGGANHDDGGKWQEEADARAKELMSINEQIDIMNRNYIRNKAGEAAAIETSIGKTKTLRELLAEMNVDAKLIGDSIGTTWVEGLRNGNGIINSTVDAFKNMINVVAETIVKQTIQLGVEKLFAMFADDKVEKEKELNREKLKGLAISIKQAAIDAGTALLSGGGGGETNFLGFNKGGIVPGGAPYNDRVPAMLTPGEVVIPRDQVGSAGKGTSYNTTINQNINTNDLNNALISAIRTNAEEVNSILSQSQG